MDSTTRLERGMEEAMHCFPRGGGKGNVGCAGGDAWRFLDDEEVGGCDAEANGLRLAGLVLGGGVFVAEGLEGREIEGCAGWEVGYR
jgi:hypothetical protein